MRAHYCPWLVNRLLSFSFGTDTSMMPYMSDDGMSENSSVVGMPQGNVLFITQGEEREFINIYFSSS